MNADWPSQFAEACLRITSKPGLDTFLRAVVDEARSIVGARYGAIQVFGDTGLSWNFITSGVAPDEGREGIRIDRTPETSTAEDGPLGISSVGLPEDPGAPQDFLETPLLHLGERVGNLLVAGKEGGLSFDQKDEMVLGLFSSYAAAAVAGARIRAPEPRTTADLAALTDILPVSVLVFDAETGDLRSINEEARRISGDLNALGCSLHRILEVTDLRTVDGHDIPIDELPTSKALRSGQTVLADDVVIHLPDGQALHTLVNARPIHRQDGVVETVVATVQDITSREAMNRQRTEILSRVNHELRAPLTAIKGSVVTMLGSHRPLNNTEAHQFLRIIDEQADRMRDLINDLVDVTQIETRTLSVTLQPTDVLELVEQARDAFLRDRVVAHDIVLDISPGLPRVAADRPRVFQVLSILLANASERSAESSAIRVSASRGDTYVAIMVEGDGGGSAIDSTASSSEGVFLTQGEGTAGNALGDHLNLAICKGIVDAHGGYLTIENGGSGGGFRCTFTIPLADETEQSAENRSTQPDVLLRRSLGGQPRVLAIDEDPETLRYIRDSLGEAGFATVVSGDTDELERVLELEQPHLVLMTLTMPWTHGSQLMERVGRISDAPVIFVYGNGSAHSTERAFELGAADYLVKPFTQTELVARVRGALRRRQGSAPASNQPSEPFALGDLSIDYAQRIVTVAGRAVQLTPTEYKLLVEFSVNAGRVLTHEQLLRLVWGPLYESDVRVIRTHVKALRYKLGDDARCPLYIFTERHVGYRMGGLATK